MITRSMVASGRWVTATKDANSIHASLASAAGEIGRTHVSSDGSRGMHHERADLAHRDVDASNGGNATISAAKSITGVFQAQCHSGRLGIFLPFPLPWNRVRARTVFSCAPAIGLFRIAARHGTE